MKKLIKKIAFIAFAAALASSCSQSSLEVQNPTALSLEDILSDDDAFLQLSNGVIDSYQKVVANEYIINELRSDNALSNTFIGDIFAINSYRLTANEGQTADYYANLYITIARANDIIGNQDIIPTNYMYTLGEAYFMRGLCHFNAVRAFLNVPFISRTIDPDPDGNDIANFPQLPPAEVYENIANDFRLAIELLQLSPSSSSYRPNANAATALLAKSLLSQPVPNYAEAQMLLASILENNSLLTGDGTTASQIAAYGNVFGNTQLDGGDWNNTGSELNDEILYSIPFVADNADDADITSSLPDVGNQVETDAESFSFFMSSSGTLSNGINIASVDLIEQLLREPVRQQVTVNNAQLLVLLNEAERNEGVLDADTEVFNNKYPYTSETRGDGNDWIVMRYADVLLLYAESILAGGVSTSNQPALDAFNQVRTRAGLPVVDVLTSDALLAERRVEFAYENQRLFDLIRFGVADAVLSEFSTENFLSYNPQRVYLPFPQSEIDATNRNGGSVYFQNPGY